jgi:pimeloyl-ACP methyl ester carboxylesterase
MAENRVVQSAKHKPVIIIIHGAWHRPLHFSGLISSLHDQGYTVAAPVLPTSGEDSGVIRAKTITKDDVGVVKAVMGPFLAAGREIIMVCHSLGGLTGTESVVGDTVPEREANGLKGGVKSFIYLSAFAPPTTGKSAVEMVGLNGEFPNWWEVDVGHVLAGIDPMLSLMPDIDILAARRRHDRVQQKCQVHLL